MPIRLQRRLQQKHPHTIDMSPLLDVVFILLIFFIVTTVFVKETGVKVDKPQAISAQKLEQTVMCITMAATLVSLVCAARWSNRNAVSLDR